ncbi:hypothetical protein [Streptomyces virginiae]|uniref:Uncharacterized protein n=1 Tax=Streptomyces virginiae TaxID=1961 RepID=A0ABZ1TN99_STRVG|nr:hypothetical protein [Streptomyces virginiae]
MSEYMYVHVPADLWTLLEEDDFDEVEAPSRSMADWASVAEAVVSYGEGTLDVSANLVGVYLAREQIGDFVRRTAAWLGLRTRDAGPLVFTITTGPSGSEVRMEISCPQGPEGTPALDTAAFAGAIASALAAPVPSPAASDTAG